MARHRTRIPLAFVGCVGLVGGLPALAQSEPGPAEIVQEWTGSAHADASSEAFAHWNGEAEVPGLCAICHAGAGFRDFHGLDGSAAGTVDQVVVPGGVVDCDTCHAEGAARIAGITFPSGITLAPLPNAATCMTCHQGRASGLTLAGSVAGMEPDAVNSELSFMNPHYAAAAATNFGTDAKGFFEYPGQSYEGRFAHVPEASTCTDCHSPHTLGVRLDTCTACHGDADPEAIRKARRDFDGDGDVAEGIAAEIAALEAILGEAIAAYAQAVPGAPIAYSGQSFPYFFADTNGNGLADPEEALRGNAYRSWTPRLLQAAFNYQFVAKDPGSFAHNPRYVLQALHDSIADLASAMDWDAPAIARP